MFGFFQKDHSQRDELIAKLIAATNAGEVKWENWGTSYMGTYNGVFVSIGRLASPNTLKVGRSPGQTSYKGGMKELYAAVNRSMNDPQAKSANISKVLGE